MAEKRKSIKESEYNRLLEAEKASASLVLTINELDAEVKKLRAEKGDFLYLEKKYNDAVRTIKEREETIRNLNQKHHKGGLFSWLKLKK